MWVVVLCVFGVGVSDGLWDVRKGKQQRDFAATLTGNHIFKKVKTIHTRKSLHKEDTETNREGQGGQRMKGGGGGGGERLEQEGTCVMGPSSESPRVRMGTKAVSSRLGVWCPDASCGCVWLCGC